MADVAWYAPSENCLKLNMHDLIPEGKNKIYIEIDNVFGFQEHIVIEDEFAEALSQINTITANFVTSFAYWALFLRRSIEQQPPLQSSGYKTLTSSMK